jgi:hypothetical protein
MTPFMARLLMVYFTDFSEWICAIIVPTAEHRLRLVGDPNLALQLLPFLSVITIVKAEK